jgi:hypothetical protein
MKNKPDNNELKSILGKLLGENNVPDDVVINTALNDIRLQKLAEYDISKGYTNMKDLTNEAIQAKFAELKTTVLTKSSTLAELETMVFTRWGVTEKPRLQIPVDQMQMPELNGISFVKEKPILGFSTLDIKTNKKKKG